METTSVGEIKPLVRTSRELLVELIRSRPMSWRNQCEGDGNQCEGDGNQCEGDGSQCEGDGML
jgi:hypothetical protein